MQKSITYLKQELEKYGNPEFCEIKWEQLDKLLDIAVNMVKTEMIDFAKQWEARQSDGNLDTIEMLYEQTYNK